MAGKKKTVSGKVKPNPKMLGSGAASKAGKALKGRQNQIDEILNRVSKGG